MLAPAPVQGWWVLTLTTPERAGNNTVAEVHARRQARGARGSLVRIAITCPSARPGRTQRQNRRYSIAVRAEGDLRSACPLLSVL